MKMISEKYESQFKFEEEIEFFFPILTDNSLQQRLRLMKLN